MTTSIAAGSNSVSASSASAARTERALTCSSGAAMCLPRRPNFSTITCSGMPERPETSAAVSHRSGRYEAVASRPTRLIPAPAPAKPAPALPVRLRRAYGSCLRLEDAADDPRQLVGDALGHRSAVAPEDPAHADHLADPHQGK